MHFLNCDVRTMPMAGVLILTTLLSGCSQDVNIDPDPRYIIPHEPRSATTQPLPLRVGIYYPSETREYRSTPIFGGGLHFELGPPTVAVFNVVLASMFEEVDEVQQLSPLSPAESDLDAIIEISIESFYFVFTIPMPCRITYRFIAYETNGTPLASWVEYGNSSAVGGSFARPSYQRAAESAILDGAKKFIGNFRSRPEIRQWLESRGIVVSAISR